MRNVIVLAAALVASTANGSEPDPREVQKSFANLFPSNPISCPDGEPHVKEIRYSRDGTLATLVVWDHGDVDREEIRRVSRAHGLDAPFDRARPTASQDD